MNAGPAIELPDVDDYDAAVAATGGIDRWCSSSDWVLPLSASMRPQRPFLLRTPSGWGLFDGVRSADGRRVVMGVDRVWGFACPVVGTSHAVWHEMGRELASRRTDLVVIPGLVEDGDAWRAAVGGLGRTHRLHRAGGIVRQQADLADGFDAWFGRRSSRFRQRMRRVRRDAAEAGVEVVDATAEGDDELIDRLIGIERTSWKGAEHEGLTSDDMAGFYRLVLARLGDRVRCLVARRDGDDVGYVVGGVRGTTYRGLQLSYADSVDELGVGHLLQLVQIERLCDEGVTTYDLGMDMDYKRRWADRTLATTTIVALPGP